MTDHDALLRGILRHPGDDLPRLVFADWLEEHDRGEYAAFIRRQCECPDESVLAEMTDTGWLVYGVVAGTALHGELSALPKYRRGTVVEYRRGFAHTVRGELTTIRRHLKRLMSTQPVQSFDVTDKLPYCRIPILGDATRQWLWMWQRFLHRDVPGVLPDAVFDRLAGGRSYAEGQPPSDRNRFYAAAGDAAADLVRVLIEAGREAAGLPSLNGVTE